MAVNMFTIPSSSVFFLFSTVFSFSHALPWTGPRPTSAYKEAAWSPAPTFVPVSPVELFRRSSVDVNVCGWIGGNSDIPATCSTGSSCIRDTIHGYVGCCTTAGACTQGVYTSCVDNNSLGWTPNAGLQNNGIYTCAGTLVCYRNTYPGGYYQYGCGDSGNEAQVETTYTGQASGVSLQVVYTGVTFNPMTGSKPSPMSTPAISSSTSTTTFLIPSSSPNTDSSTSVTSTISNYKTGETSPTISISALTSTQTAAPTQSPTSGIIIGSVVASVAAVTGLLALLLCFCRRRQNKMPDHNGLFIMQHKFQGSSVSGFQRVTPYSPEDFVTGNARSETPPEQDITGAFTYGGPEVSLPSGAAERWGSIRESARMMENVSLVASEDEHSHGNQNSLAGRETQIHMAPDMAMGVALLQRTRSRSPNHWTQDQNLKAQLSQTEQSQNQSFVPQEEGWTPQGLYGNTQGQVRSFSTISIFHGSLSHSNVTSISTSGSGDGDVSPEIPIPPKSPLRQSMRGNRIGSLGSTMVSPIERVMVADSPIDASKRRYQLVDEVARSSVVPILGIPGRLRRTDGSQIGRRGRQGRYGENELLDCF